MSIVYPAELLSASSGSAGDTVRSHNQYGPYARARTTPTDPNTAQQQAVRSALAQCVTAWNSVLTQPEREAWDRFALACPTRGPLGRRTNPGGLAAYVRANVSRLQAAEVTLPRVDQASTLFDRVPFTPVTHAVLNIVDDTIHPFFEPTDPWACTTGAAMLFWVSAPKPLTVNFWKGPYRYAGPILGSTSPNDTPGTIPIPHPAGSGTRVFVRLRVTAEDGRLSSSVRLPAEPVPQVPPLPVLATIYGGAPLQATIIVDFDSPIRPGLFLPVQWTARYNGVLWACTGVAVIDGSVVLQMIAAGTTARPNVLTYTPPPLTVYGLLTGLPVAGFSIPLGP